MNDVKGVNQAHPRGVGALRLGNIGTATPREGLIKQILKLRGD